MGAYLGIVGSNNTNAAQYKTNTGFAVPAGDWTLMLWDCPNAGAAGNVISRGGLAAAPCINLIFGANGYRAGGIDDAGNTLFSGGTLDTIGGAAPNAYFTVSDAAFTPRLHFIIRRAGVSEYWVAEGGHAPVNVATETRTFGALALGNWGIGSTGGTANYEAAVEGFAFATAAISLKDMALAAAGVKPTSLASLTGALPVYYPIEDANLSNTANPATQTNLGSSGTVVFVRQGLITNFSDSPVMRGATANNQTIGTTTEPTNVVALAPVAEAFSVIRHNSGSASLTFTGTDWGTGTADVQLRFVINGPGGATTSAWQTIATASAGNGSAISAVVVVPKGYWRNIETRRVNSAGGTGDSSRPNRTWVPWAVGEVVAVFGDSFQGQIDGATRYGLLAPNSYTAKLGTTSSVTGIARSHWTHLQGTTGAIGGALGENMIANNLSEASQCCVGIGVFWAGASLLANWNGRLSSATFTSAKVAFDVQGGLNRPSIITWVMNRQAGQDISTSDQCYADMEAFRVTLDGWLGAGTYHIAYMTAPQTYAPDTTGQATLARSNFHVLRVETKRWCEDNPSISTHGNIAYGYVAPDGTHPGDDARIDLLDPLWGNFVAWIRGAPTAIKPRGPFIRKFTRVGGTLVVKVAGLGAASLLLKSGANASGFTLSDDNFTTSATIASATLTAADEITLTPASLPAGAVRLRYLYGTPGVKAGGSPDTSTDAGTNNVLYSDATIQGKQAMAVLPILGDVTTYYALAEGVDLGDDGVGAHFTPLLMLMCH